VNENLNLQGLKDFADTLEASGVRALSLNAAYDNGAPEGYEAWMLWGGLAISDHMSVHPAIGSPDDFKALAKHLHDKDMKLLTWFNPSYVWTGSPHFKMAEEHMQAAGGNVTKTPADSPARWFKWGPLESGTVSRPPNDDPWRPVGSGDQKYSGPQKSWRWVKDTNANAAYMSVWSDQPTVDMASEKWHDQLRNFFKFWIGLGIDGFVFDYPDGYIDAGVDSGNLGWDYDPEMIRTALSGVVRDVGKGKVAAFAELYEAPDRTVEYGLDGSLGDTSDMDRANLIVSQIAAGVSDQIEEAFTGTGGVDAIVAMTYYMQPEFAPIAWIRPNVYASGISGDDRGKPLTCWKDHGATWAPDVASVTTLDDCFHLCSVNRVPGWEKCDAITYEWATGKCYLRGGLTISDCKVDWGFTTFDFDAKKKTRLALALSAGAGYATGIEVAGPGKFWRHDDFPGSEDAETKTLFRSLEGTVFKPLSLRKQLPIKDSDAAYAMLRYDALGTGEARREE